MTQFLSDMIHLTEGEKFIKYWWLWLLIIVVVFTYLYLSKGKDDNFE